ncbi:MAG: DUF1190 domain-containing protein [Aliishimia sp.]
MKRSRSVTLLTMASAAMVLTACEEKIDTEGDVYRSVAECEQAALVPDADCTPLLDEGQRIHLAAGPRYNTLALCESQHGKNACNTMSQETQDFSSPIPVGYFVTGAIAGAVVADLVRPVYGERESRRYYTTGGGYLSLMNNGRYGTTRSSIQRYNPAVKQAPPRIQTRTTVASRGGFGSRSGSFGG